MTMINQRFWEGRRVFLTGYTGFKGSWMALWLTYLDPQSEAMGVALIVSTIFIILIYSLWALFYFGSFLPTFGVKETK